MSLERFTVYWYSQHSSEASYCCVQYVSLYTLYMHISEHSMRGCQTWPVSSGFDIVFCAGVMMPH